MSEEDDEASERAAKVARLKRQVNEGTYEVDAAAVAGRMLETGALDEETLDQAQAGANDAPTEDASDDKTSAEAGAADKADEANEADDKAS